MAVSHIFFNLQDRLCGVQKKKNKKDTKRRGEYSIKEGKMLLTECESKKWKIKQWTIKMMNREGKGEKGEFAQIVNNSNQIITTTWTTTSVQLEQY